jgi:hypothetical protein
MSDVISDDSASPTSTDVAVNRSVRRVRLVALVAVLAGCTALAAAYSPWFRSTSRLAQSTLSAPADKVCASQGGIVVTNAQGTPQCAVWDTTVTGKELATQSSYAARANDVTKGIAYEELPSTIMGLPAPTFWAVLAALLVLVACAAHSIIASILAPLASMLAWSALSKFAAYATNPAHGGSFVEQCSGVTLTKASIGVVGVMSVSAATAVVKERRALWRERQAQGLPATALATVIRGAVTRTLADAARFAQEANP